MIWQRRFDPKTTASLLQGYLEVVSPGAIQGTEDMIPGIHKWEGKVACLKTRYNESLSDSLKLAIFVGMLPKEYQDVVL